MGPILLPPHMRPIFAASQIESIFCCSHIWGLFCCSHTHRALWSPQMWHNDILLAPHMTWGLFCCPHTCGIFRVTTPVFCDVRLTFSDSGKAWSSDRFSIGFTLMSVLYRHIRIILYIFDFESNENKIARYNKNLQISEV